MSNAPVEQELTANDSLSVLWAKARMPLLERAVHVLIADGSLQGIRVGLCLPLDEKCAVLAQRLMHSGADVSCLSPQPLASSEIVASLGNNDVAVFVSEHQADNGFDLLQVQAFMSGKPEIIVDSDGSMLSIAHEHFIDSVAGLKGAIVLEKTGVDAVLALLEQQLLTIPVVNLNDSQLVSLYKNKSGTGQSVVMALLDISNLQIAGRNILIIGYGPVGQGVALHAAAMGARVTVAEINPLRALQAVYDGHTVKTLLEAVTDAEVVFSASGAAGSLKPEHIDSMADGVIICSAGSGQAELPMPYFLQEATSEVVREHVTDFHFPSGKHVLLIAGGHCINKAAAQGEPLETVDKIMALQLAALQFLLSSNVSLAAGLHLLPEAIEKSIAREQLSQSGLRLEVEG